jgi:bifunctional polynucleotide phosphatase/kinase
MWTTMEKQYNGGVVVDRSESIYCGDAAGRIATGSRKADHSCADRCFALNLNVPFLTPEQLFLNQLKEESYVISAFQPRVHLRTRESRFEPGNQWN